MSRNLDTTFAQQIAANGVALSFLVAITFLSDTRYVWNGPGDLSYGGNTYTGVGDFGGIGDISGGTDVYAQGTSVTLSGIDPIFLDEAMDDVQVGAAAKIMFASVNPSMQIVGVPYVLYAGVVDAPMVNMALPSPENPDPKCTITLNIENRMFDLQRPQQQRYTAAEQHLLYPADTAFNWVETENDIALRWGS